MSGGTANTGGKSEPQGLRLVLGSRHEWPIVAMLSIGGLLLTLAHRLSADEGQVLTGAWNLFNGSRLYEDFFEFIGPASFVWIDLFFRALGASYTAALVASQLLLLVSIWAFYASCRLIIRKRMPALAVSVLWLLLATTPPFINHNTYSTFLATAVAFFLLRSLFTGSAAMALSGGIAAGLTVFFLQPKGAALILVGALGLVGLVDRKRPSHGRGPFALSLSYLLGAATVGACGLWAWGLYPFTTVLAVAEGNIAMNHIALSYAPLALAIALAVLLAAACYREQLLDRATILLLLLQVGLWGSVLHLPDTWHLTVNGFPLLMVGGRLAERSWARSRSRRWQLSLVFLLTLVVGMGGVRSISRNVRDTRAAREWIDIMERIIGGDEFFAFTFLPSFYLELGVPDPYYNSVLYTASSPREHFERNVDVLSRQQPRFVLADYSTVEKYGHTLDNPVDRFIRSHYRRVRELPHTTGVMEVWELRPVGDQL